MHSKRLGGVCAAIGLALGLGACVDDYGYGGVQVGYGAGGYYGDPYYDGFGYGGLGYAPSYFGWYNNFYYPGTGVYVYDRYRRPYRWNDTQRRYWSGRQQYRGRDWNGRGSWDGFNRPNVPNRNWDGNRRSQGNPDGVPGNRQWRGNPNGTPGNPRWQGNPNGTPGAGRYGGTPGQRTWRGNPGQGFQRSPDAPRFRGGDGGAGRSFGAPSSPRGPSVSRGDSRPLRGAERPQ